MHSGKEVMLPLDPLLKLFGNQWEELGLEHIADACGFSKSALIRWKRKETVTLIYAEQCATKLGLHPSEIWGMSYYFACWEEEAKTAEKYEKFLKRKGEAQKRMKQKRKQSQTS